ncbi:hypothetical protein ACQ4LE_010313 [Meloidogyne hapla]
MELGVILYDQSEVVITNQGNKISRKAKTYGTQNIMLSGNTIVMRDVLLRGDLAHIRFGKYCVLQEGTIIRPPSKYFSKGLTFFPVHFGEYIFIEKNCVIEAVFIGNYVHIGEGCIIGQSCVLKNCCYIKPNSVISPDTVIPPFSIVEGNPARVVGEWVLCAVQLMTDVCQSFFDNYLPETVLKDSMTNLS